METGGSPMKISPKYFSAAFVLLALFAAALTMQGATAPSPATTQPATNATSTPDPTPAPGCTPAVNYGILPPDPHAGYFCGCKITYDDGTVIFKPVDSGMSP